MDVCCMMQGGMELRVLHAAAHKVTWYGRWGYHFGRGAFNITHNKWVTSAPAYRVFGSRSLFSSIHPPLEEWMDGCLLFK